ncbi:MAG: hypothetical protein JWR52_1625 [Marmoricola sp.]|nr:hypothetical protein [Marmoricola sp.]
MMRSIPPQAMRTPLTPIRNRAHVEGSTPAATNHTPAITNRRKPTSESLTLACWEIARRFMLTTLVVAPDRAHRARRRSPVTTTVLGHPIRRSKFSAPPTRARWLQAAVQLWPGRSCACTPCAITSVLFQADLHVVWRRATARTNDDDRSESASPPVFEHRHGGQSRRVEPNLPMGQPRPRRGASRARAVDRQRPTRAATGRMGRCVGTPCVGEPRCGTPRPTK